MRLLFITIEFSVGTFSGNGIYGMGQVRALRGQDHQVLVLCGRPDTSAAGADVPGEQQTVALPAWGCLDEQCSWHEFADGAGSHAVAAAVAAFEPEAALGVDWHSLGAWQRLQRHRLCSGLACVPYAYLNYRVYSRTAVGDGHKLLQQKERDCVAAAATVICLSCSDADHIRSHLMPSATAQQPQVHVLLPALRADVAALPLPADMAAAASLSNEHADRLPPSKAPGCTLLPAAASQQSQSVQQSDGAGSHSNQWQRNTEAGSRQRRYLTCCVRLSPEKDPHRFVDIVEALAKRPAAADAPARDAPAVPNGFISTSHGSCAAQPADGPANGSGGLGLSLPAYGSCEPSQCSSSGADTTTRLQRLGVVPLLCGATDTEYAQALRARLRAAAPEAVVEQRFLSPTQLAEVFAATRLNIHPCAYDAYGMTVVEAASQGAPSVVAVGGAVGATDLLSGAAGECFDVDMKRSPEQLADEVERILGDEAALAAVRARAARKARSWTEEANAMQLIALVEAAVQRRALD